VAILGRRISVIGRAENLPLQLLGQTTLVFTTKDFEDRESALSHYKKFGERARQTRID